MPAWRLALSFAAVAIFPVSPVLAADGSATELYAGSAAAPEIRVERAPAGAPNVVIVLLDDVGFGAASTFGGPIETPTLDRLAGAGLRYNRFHTTAICSPTRAALLTGRNPHAVGVGAVMNSASKYQGYRGVIPATAATLAEILRQNGYSTGAFGKWHLTPDWEASPAGPFERWPTGMGFEKFYGFLGGETHQFEPTLFEGTRPIRRPARADYHLSEDLADQAVAWMQLQHAVTPERPFLVYFAPGATHAPIHAPKAWIDRFAGRFDRGWDALREEIFARQKRQGVVPADAVLTPRPEQLPAWEDLSPERRRIAARFMEAYAGFLAHTDAQVGKLVAALEQMGERDDTLFFYIVGDNGASGEGGADGAWNYFAAFFGVNDDPAALLGRLDELGGTSSYPHYPAGWAWAMNAPFQWMKTVASHLGGTRTPLVVSWPRGIRERGGLRSQFSYVSDIAPTILDAAGIAAPAIVNGVAQQPLDGVSLLQSFADAKAPSLHRTQYFEVYGNRAIYHDGWMAGAFRGRMPWLVFSSGQGPIADDEWELYHLDSDFSQARDLAKAEPARLRELQDLFWAEFASNRGLPLHDSARAEGLPRLAAGRDSFVFHEGAIGIPESAAPAFFNRSFTIEAQILVPESGAQGVIVAEGGVVAGWSLYVDAAGRPTYSYNFFGAERSTITASEALASGERTLGFDFAYDGGIGGGGVGRLRVDGKPVAQGRIPRTAPVFYSIDETFDVGIDTGSPAGDYPAGNAWSGGIERVAIELE
jgi:arylsulfatase A-like enzyme